MTIDQLSSDPRVTIRRRAAPNADGDAVIYWMQRAQRAVDNPALDVAIIAANLLRKPLVVFFGLNPFVERANLRHYTFLAEGLADLAAGVAARRGTFVLRAHPHHRLAPFLEEVRPAMVIGGSRAASPGRDRRSAVTASTSASTLGKEDPGVERVAGRSLRDRRHAERPV
jgi:deoxyribodipyrimidine photolyase